jgi:hypothetical protein
MAIEIPLSEAARRLGISWHQAWRLLLVGALKGRKEGGRWVVEDSSVEQRASLQKTPFAS